MFIHVLNFIYKSLCFSPEELAEQKAVNVKGLTLTGTLWWQYENYVKTFGA